MEEEGAGELSKNQIPPRFIILVRRVGCYPEREEEQREGLNSERSGWITGSPCLENGG